MKRSPKIDESELSKTENEEIEAELKKLGYI